MDKKVSVIIPACNEEKVIRETAKFYREQDYPLEIIVVVNNSKDRTSKMAEGLSDKVLNFSGKIGAGGARNEGAKVAEGDIFIFSDADSYLEQGSVKLLVSEFDKNPNIVGSFSGKDDKNSLKGKIFFLFKNLAYRLKLHEGATAGTIFCSREIFFETSGFDSSKQPIDIHDFILKAKAAGARYKFITSCHAVTSMRRYEDGGYLKTIIFWLKLRLLSLLKINNNLAENYFKETKNVQKNNTR